MNFAELEGLLDINLAECANNEVSLVVQPGIGKTLPIVLMIMEEKREALENELSSILSNSRCPELLACPIFLLYK
jgi:hypothetical protein